MNSACRRTAIVATAFLGVLPSAATAQSTGGLSSPQRPHVNGVICQPSQVCRRGAEMTITGRGLADARRVVFKGASGRRDDRAARPLRTGDGELAVRIPSRARSGPVWVEGVDGRTARWRSVRVAAARTLSDAEQLAGKVFLDGAPAQFSYRAQPGAVVELVALGTGSVVARWPAQVDAAGDGRLTWDGRIAGQHAPVGSYAFRVAGASTASASSTGSSNRFELLDHIFPIRGRHDLGQTATNGFGGDRGHQGQDMFASCGTRLVVARGGVLTEAKFDSRAGNYAVITDDTGQSDVYMHMRDPALVKRGQRVITGQPLGFVGATGRADGCHLHFELWTAPGWYQGGEPIDALPELRRWDAAT